MRAWSTGNQFEQVAGMFVVDRFVDKFLAAPNSVYEIIVDPS